MEKKRTLEARLRGIQRSLERVDSAHLLRLQRELLEEYEKILFQEEILWFQKSREKWIKLGSRNTSFFHAQTIVRRKRNKIHGIHLPSGEWCTDQNILQNEAVNFFKTLFCSTEVTSRALLGHITNTLGNEMSIDLARPVEKEEVHMALMGIQSYKAPGQGSWA